MHEIPCYFPNSVSIETERKVKGTIDFIGNTIRNDLIRGLEVNRRQKHIALGNPLTNQDIRVLEQVFYGIHGAARAQNTLTEPVSLIEDWAISFLAEKLENGDKITIQELGTELIKSVLKFTSALQYSLEYLLTYQRGFVKKKNLPPDPRFGIIKTNLEIEGIHAPDSDHIAFAVLNSVLYSDKTIFVTLDFKTILSKRDIILANHKIECCDPLYAIHHT